VGENIRNKSLARRIGGGMTLHAGGHICTVEPTLLDGNSLRWNIEAVAVPWSDYGVSDADGRWKLYIFHMVFSEALKLAGWV
jgi:hypothetical protein